MAKQIDFDFDNFLEKIYRVYGYDFRSYNRASIERRVNFNLLKSNYNDIFELEREVLKDRFEFEKLLDSLSINITEFFRNEKTLAYIKESIFKYLASFHHIKIWCAGCSSGEEPYSLAILLHEANLLKKSQIYATDIDKNILIKAKEAKYSVDILEKESSYKKSGGDSNLSKYFEKRDSNLYLKDEIKKRVLFFEHNLAIDGVINEFELILCKNTIIYFDENLKDRVFKLFYKSLYKNGYLILGDSERIVDTNKNLFNNLKSNIYRRII